MRKSAEYECEYYHPLHDKQIIAASTETLQVNGEEVSSIVTHNEPIHEVNVSLDVSFNDNRQTLKC